MDNQLIINQAYDYARTSDSNFIDFYKKYMINHGFLT